MRQLVTIRKIEDVLPIEGADLIQLVKIGGWQCVAKVGEFRPGDLCVYFEIDSFLPVRPEFEFLRKNSFRKMGEEEGFRIRTVKLRGQLSQGLALPISRDLEAEWAHTFLNLEGARPLQAGDEVTGILGVQKYEPPVPTELSGQIRGNFPAFIPKTDQERCQNIVDEIFVVNKDSSYEVTMKMDGTSFTAYRYMHDNGVCGRNWELKTDGSNEYNSLVRMYLSSGLQSALLSLGKDYAVQGELMGPNIQKNRESLKEHKLYVFDIYDIGRACYLTPAERHAAMNALWEHGLSRETVEHVKVMAMGATLSDLGITTVSELLLKAEGPSLNHPIREGNVYKRLDGRFSFKAISNKFLLKSGD